MAPGRPSSSGSVPLPTKRIDKPLVAEDRGYLEGPSIPLLIRVPQEVPVVGPPGVLPCGTAKQVAKRMSPPHSPADTYHVVD